MFCAKKRGGILFVWWLVWLVGFWFCFVLFCLGFLWFVLGIFGLVWVGLGFFWFSKIILRVYSAGFVSGMYILQILWGHDSSLTGSPQQETLTYSAHCCYLILLILHTMVVLTLSGREVLMKYLNSEKYKDILLTVRLGLLYAF